MACSRCTADPQPEDFGSPRQCAFDAEGKFTPDNWNCATLNLLIDKAQNTIHGFDEQFEVTPVNGDDYGGWVITSRYKSRGKTSSAIWVGDFFPPQPVTLALVERILAGQHTDDDE